jgi:hypothetical protein
LLSTIQVLCPFKRERFGVLSGVETVETVVNKSIRRDERIENEPEEVLINPKAQRVVRIARSCVFWNPLCNQITKRTLEHSLSKTPESGKNWRTVVSMVTNEMRSLSRVQKSLDRPAVFPVNATVCVSEQDEIDIGLVNRKESVHRVFVADDPGVPNNHLGRPSKPLSKRPRYVVSEVHIDSPGGIVVLNEDKVLQQSIVIFRGLWSIEAERKGVYHLILVKSPSHK